MSKSVKWAGTCPGGQVITRTTARTYSHAVIGRRVMPGDVSTPWHVVGWCGRLDLAEALANRQRRGMAEHGEGSPEVVVIPVAPVVRPGSDVDQVTPARVKFVAPADADDILASDVAAMNAALADMARAAVKDLAGGDLADAWVRLSHDIAALWAALDDPAHPCRLGHLECATRPGGACLNAIYAERYAQGVEE